MFVDMNGGTLLGVLNSQKGTPQMYTIWTAASLITTTGAGGWGNAQLERPTR